MFKIMSLFLFFIVFTASLFATADCLAASNEDLTQLSLEDLMDIKITSASKKSQRLSEVAAAVFVITQEDIRRSGVTSIPEALRMVPGVQVAKIDANKWAITARGSNGRFANKLLVLMDGRNVYTPIYSGVFWENIDTVLEDIDRIEVIRGPGASLWGANAVNGVINIITKQADETQGILASGSIGSEEKGSVSLRYGGKILDKTPFRLYFKGFERDGAVDENGDDTADDWRYLRGGFRLDHRRGSRDHLTLQGDIFDGTNGEILESPSITPPYLDRHNNDHKEKGHNLLARWTRTLSSLSEISLQAYYNSNEHTLHLTKAEIDTFDVEFQHRLPIGKRHDVTWGFGYRLYQDHYESDAALLTMDTASIDYSIFNAFIQDEIGFFDKRLRLTLGSKFEHNDFTHSEFQPNARLIWLPNDRHSTWASVSRAVRTPSRVERDATALMTVIPPATAGGLPAAVTYYGSQNFDSEELISYELGYRVKVTPELTLDAALYYNDYEDLRQTTIDEATIDGWPPTHVILSSTGTNNAHGEVHGFEFAADWKMTEWSLLEAAYTYMDMDMDYGDSNILAEQDPQNQLSLRASLDLPWNLDLDLWYRHVSEVSDIVDGYDTVDLRLGWKYGKTVEVSVVGQNLLAEHHLEFQPEGLHTVETEVERSVYGKLTVRF